MATSETKTTEVTNTNDYAKKNEERFEFVLFINDHIICQRYLNIRDYNEDAIKSLELKDLADSIVGVNNGSFGEVGIIPKHLKNKAIEYLWSNYNPYYTKPETTTDKIDNFQFEVRVDKKVVLSSGFSGNLFPPRVRYAVDIKEIIPSIMSEIRYYLSQKNYTIV